MSSCPLWQWNAARLRTWKGRRTWISVVYKCRIMSISFLDVFWMGGHFQFSSPFARPLPCTNAFEPFEMQEATRLPISLKPILRRNLWKHAPFAVPRTFLNLSWLPRHGIGHWDLASSVEHLLEPVRWAQPFVYPENCNRLEETCLPTPIL